MSALAIIGRVKRLQRIRAAAQPKAPKKKAVATVQIKATATDLDRWADDFPAFAELLDIIPKEGGQRQKLRPNAIQSAFEVSRTGRDIVLKPRQVGLTTYELARDVHNFLTRRGAHVVIVCQSSKDDSATMEISDKLRVMFESLREAGVVIPDLDASTTKWVIPSRDAKLRIVDAGASKAAAEKKGRGGTIRRLHVTELAFFEYAAVTMNAILESLAKDAEVVFESTANGAAGYFFDAFQDAKSKRSSYRAHFFRWMDQAEYATALEPGEVVTPETVRERDVVAAGATPEQLKWYRQKVLDKKSQDLVDQEYPLDEESCWLTAGRLFFDKDRTKQLLTETREPIEVVDLSRFGAGGELRIFKHPQPGRRYLLAIDPSEGVGGDPGALVVLDRGTGEHVATIHGQFPPWAMARLAANLGRGFALITKDERLAKVEDLGISYGTAQKPALIVVERNNHGHAVLAGLIREQRYTFLFIGSDKRPGWLTNEITRANALAALFNAHKEEHWGSPEKQSIAEMLRFIVLASGRPEHAPGAHDDLILAHAVGWDVCCRPMNDDHHYVPPGMVA